MAKAASVAAEKPHRLDLKRRPAGMALPAALGLGLLLAGAAAGLFGGLDVNQPRRQRGAAAPWALQLLLPASHDTDPLLKVGPAAEVCAQMRSPELRGPISNETAAGIVATLLRFQATAQNCGVFMTNFREPHDEFFSWGPSWEWAGRPAACGEFCDPQATPLADRQAAARAIYRHQHPADCSRAKFLVAQKEWDAGLGSAINVKAYVLISAMQMGRVLIHDPEATWDFTDPASCPSQDWSCYFAPITNCTLPKGWNTSGEGVEPLGGARRDSPARFLVTPVRPISPADPVTELGINRESVWWMAAASVYLVRPAHRTLNAACFAWRCVFGTAPPRRPMAALFIRHGDKWKERAVMRNASEYFDALSDFASRAPAGASKMGTVYLGSDDATTMARAVECYGREWPLRWLGYHRDVGGLVMEEVHARYNSPRAEWQVLLSLADLYITAAADVRVGTLSSNWGRLVNEMARSRQERGFKYISLENRRR